jgi:ankyrin repeat protein
MSAAEQGHFEIVKALLQKKATVNLQTNSGLSALHLAIRNIEIVEILIENGANVNMISETYGTPILQAAIYGHLEVVQYLIEKKADINLSTNNGKTPLMSAVEQGHFEIVKALLQKTATVNLQTNSGLSALHLAIRNIEIVEILIENGANVDIISEILGAPITQAARLGHLDVVQHLIEKKADINLSTINGPTPLMSAAGNGQFEIVKALLQKKAKVNAQTYGGLSALHFAVMNIDGSREIVEILIENGANVNIISEIHGTPIIQAVRLEKLGMVQHLIEKKADINLSTINGETPLMAAAEKGYFEIVKALVKSNPLLPVTKQRSDGRSALSLAELNGHSLITEFLCEIAYEQM